VEYVELHGNSNDMREYDALFGESDDNDEKFEGF